VKAFLKYFGLVAGLLNDVRMHLGEFASSFW